MGRDWDWDWDGDGGRCFMTASQTMEFPWRAFSAFYNGVLDILSYPPC